MDDVPIRLFIIAVALVVSMYFAGTEASLLNVNKIRMMSLADNGSKKAKRVLYILNNYDRAIITLLIGNNIGHITFATVVTVMVTGIWGSGAVALSTVASTVVVFLLGELLPKIFAKQFNEKFAMAVSGSLILIMKVLYPLAVVFNGISNILSKPFKLSEEEEPTVTEEELKDIIENIAEESDLDEEKSELMQSALEFGYTAARDVMTPWEKVNVIRSDIPKPELLEIIKNGRISRLPVVGTRGTVKGVLQVRRFLKAHISTGGTIEMSECMDKAHFVADETPLDELLSRMSKSKTHFCFVRNVAGETIGIITMEDILEELVGEIYDEDDPEGGIA